MLQNITQALLLEMTDFSIKLEDISSWEQRLALLLEDETVAWDYAAAKKAIQSLEQRILANPNCYRLLPYCYSFWFKLAISSAFDRREQVLLREKNAIVSRKFSKQGDYF